MITFERDRIKDLPRALNWSMLSEDHPLWIGESGDIRVVVRTCISGYSLTKLVAGKIVERAVAHRWDLVNPWIAEMAA